MSCHRVAKSPPGQGGYKRSPTKEGAKRQAQEAFEVLFGPAPGMPLTLHRNLFRNGRFPFALVHAKHFAQVVINSPDRPHKCKQRGTSGLVSQLPGQVGRSDRPSRPRRNVISISHLQLGDELREQQAIMPGATVEVCNRVATATWVRGS